MRSNCQDMVANTVSIIIIILVIIICLVPFAEVLTGISRILGHHYCIQQIVLLLLPF